MKANVEFTFWAAALVLAMAISSVRVSASPNPPVKSGVQALCDRLWRR